MHAEGNGFSFGRSYGRQWEQTIEQKKKKTSPIRGTGFFLNSRSINLFITICDYDQVKKKKIRDRIFNAVSPHGIPRSNCYVFLVSFHKSKQWRREFRDRAGGGAGGGGGVALPRHFSAVQNKNKESSNKIEEEISLVRNGVAI